jgi:hypothetical protein
VGRQIKRRKSHDNSLRSRVVCRGIQKNARQKDARAVSRRGHLAVAEMGSGEGGTIYSGTSLYSTFSISIFHKIKKIIGPRGVSQRPRGVAIGPRGVARGPRGSYATKKKLGPECLAPFLVRVHRTQTKKRG